MTVAEPTLTASTVPAPENNLYSYLLGNLQPESVALISTEGATTYGALVQQAQQVAAALLLVGVGKGDRVCILGENSPFWVASYLAIVRIGAVAAPLPMRFSESQVQSALAMLGCHTACIDAKRLAKLAAALPDDLRVISNHAPAASVTRDVVIPGQGDAPAAAVETCAVDDRADLAALMFTSGSTGEPNAVKVSHRNIAANTEAIISYLELAASDRIMVVLPFDYCFGTSLLHTHLRAGASLVLHNSFVFLEDLLNEMDETACTGFAGVPASYQHLLRRSSLPRRQFPHLRYVQQAGGRLPDTLIREFTAAQPDVRFFVMYGQTEATARLSYLPPERLGDKLGSIGRGLPGLTLRILDAQGNPVAPGEVGEIVAEGDSITLGYWRPDPDKQPFRDGKLYTSDMARMDAEGFIFIEDRAGDFIKPNGHRVSSREVEEILSQIPDVIEVAVIGMPHPELGEAVRAFIVKKRGSPLTEAEVLEYCKKRMQSYVVPREIRFLNDLPKNDAQKVLKKELKRLYAAPS